MLGRAHVSGPGNEWATDGAERCRNLRAATEPQTRQVCRRIGLLRHAATPSRTAMVRKGSPVRVRQRAPQDFPALLPDPARPEVVTAADTSAVVVHRLAETA